MCRLCKATPEGKRLYRAATDAEEAVIAAGITPGAAGFLRRYQAREVVDEQPTNDALFGGDEATVLDRYNAAVDARRQYHAAICQRLGRQDAEITKLAMEVYNK